MASEPQLSSQKSLRSVRLLTYITFGVFAMTTDSVGALIPSVVETFRLSLGKAGALQYSTVCGVAVAGLFLGFLAEYIGHKKTIILSLAVFASCMLGFQFEHTFPAIVCLLFVSGLAIGMFKAVATALVALLSVSLTEHTRVMTMAEGYYALGGVFGPLISTFFLSHGLPWHDLYLTAGVAGFALVLLVQFLKFPRRPHVEVKRPKILRTLQIVRDPLALAFGTAEMLYVGVEASIYVWLPTFLGAYSKVNPLIAGYGLSAFFLLRAGGRFFLSSLVSKLSWTVAILVSSAFVLACFLISLISGEIAVICLPISGLFMAIIYPVLNSKGVSCFKAEDHGAVGGIFLFFSCLGALGGPFATGLISDVFFSPKYGLWFATGQAAVLCGVLCLFNCRQIGALRLAVNEASSG